ncbi:MAG: carboxypeptidase-like regulatory domain-containing protein, partial [Planctomycetaceae bacterium]|nr:carboxypeptidase-like regulatory domain-containing protein [Planctomycetaceae bacterium]
MTINLTKYFVFALLVALGLLTGCPNNSVNSEFCVVTGTVFLNDSPVEGARVTFFPLDTSGLAASGFTDASGKYSLTADGSLSGGTGTKPGQYRVT